VKGERAKNNSDTERRWEDIYRGSPLEELPWEEGRPAAELVTLIESGLVEKGAALEICCGSGNNAVYLAKQGFTIHGIDISPTAISHARKKATEEGVKCELVTGNTLQLPYPDSTFTLVFDRGCFHSIAPHDRQTFVKSVYRVLKPTGKYQLICFSSRDHRSGPPYTFSPKDLRRNFLPFFKILYIKELCKIMNTSKSYFLSALMEKG